MVRGGKVSVQDEASEEADAVDQAVAVRPKRSVQGRGKARDGVKSSSIGSSAIGSGAIFASR
jgi:hypothetical protein